MVEKTISAFMYPVLVTYKLYSSLGSSAIENAPLEPVITSFDIPELLEILTTAPLRAFPSCLTTPSTLQVN